MAGTSVKRRYPRTKAPRSVVVPWKTAEYREVSHVGAMTMGGLFIQTKKPAKLGTMIQMLIVTPRGNARFRASVRSVIEGEGMGVQIISMESQDRGKLDRWMKELLVKEKQ